MIMFTMAKTMIMFTMAKTMIMFNVDKRIFYQREKSPVDVLSGTKTRISCENKSATSS